MAVATYQSAGGTNSAVQDDPTKPKPLNLPYMDPRSPNQILPVTNTAVVGNPQNKQPQAPPLNGPQLAPNQQPQPQQNNVQSQRDQAMSTLLSKANQPQQQSPVQNLVTQKTTQLLQDPTQGWNGEQYKQTQLSDYDRNEAQMFEALRQQFADSADTGQFRKDALGNQLESVANRRKLGSDIDYEKRDFKQKSLIDALAEGRATEKQNQDINSSTIDNLAKALQAGEGEAQRAADVANREDIQQYDTSERISKQDYDAQQADLDRQQAIALQNGDIAGQERIAKLKSDLDLKYLGQQQSFAGSESALDRNLQLTLKGMDIEGQKAVTTLKGQIDQGLQTNDQTWKSAEEALNRQQAILLQNGDIAGSLQIETLKANLQEKYQQNREAYQTHEREMTQIYNTNERLDTQNYEKNMKYLENDLYAIRSQGDAEIAKQLKNLDAQIAEAKASNDLLRAKDLENYRGLVEKDVANAAFANTKEAMTLQSQIDEAKANNDQNRVVELENLKANQAEKYAQNRAAEATQVAQKQFDYDWLMQNNGFSHDEKMANLQAQIDQAKSENDYETEKKLISLKASIDYANTQELYGHEEAMANLQANINKAAAAQDFEYATALKGQEIKATAEENAKDRAIQLSELALKQDAAAYQRYEEMSQTDPAGAAAYLKSELAKKGISYNPVDAVEQAKKAVMADFEVAKEQYKLTHNGSLEGFNDFYNNSMYGDKTPTDIIDQIVSGEFTYQQLKADPQKLEAAKANAIPWDATIYKNKEGKNMYEFNTMPEMNVPFKDQYGTYIRISDPVRKTEFGTDRQQFQAIVLGTGLVTTFTAY